MTTSWNALTVLVTGGRGFLGSHVVERLAQLGATTYGLARESPALNDNIRWLSGDLSDPSAVQTLLKQVRPDVVFHLAGQTVAAPDRKLVLPSFRNNLASTIFLLDAAADVGCRRIVITGSLEEPVPGESDLVPTSPYGISKWAETVYARMFHRLYQLPVVIVRPYMTYGPRQRPTKLIPHIALSLLSGRSPTINNASREVDWIYVDDTVDGIVAAGQAPGVEGCTADLGSGVLVPIHEIANELRSLIGGNATVQFARSEVPVGVHGRKADTQRARELLGWSANTPLREGLERTVAWYRARVADYGSVH